MENHQWYLRFENKRYPIQYSVYHLTKDSRTYETFHEIEFEGRIITKKSLEEVVKSIGKLIRRKQ